VYLVALCCFYFRNAIFVTRVLPSAYYHWLEVPRTYGSSLRSDQRRFLMRQMCQRDGFLSMEAPRVREVETLSPDRGLIEKEENAHVINPTDSAALERPGDPFNLEAILYIFLFESCARRTDYRIKFHCLPRNILVTSPSSSP